MRVAILAGIGIALAAQENTSSFEVASVKHIGDRMSMTVRGARGVRSTMQPCRYTPASVSCKITLQSVLLDMYHIKLFQLEAPAWVANEVYQIEARMPDGTPPEAGPAMMERLLGERLGMVARREKRETSVYALVVVPGSNKLEEVTPAPPGYGARFGSGIYEAMPAMPLSGLTGLLQQAAGRPVLDETGRTGYYKVKLQWTPPPNDDAPGKSVAVDPGIISALSQLGLKLQPAKRTIDYVVVEKVSKEPTEN